MSNNTAQIKPSTNFEIAFTHFDFNLDTMRWISNQFSSARGAHIVKLSDAMRWWGTERSANPHVNVMYKIEGYQSAGRLTNGREWIYFAEANAEEKDIVSVLLTTTRATEMVFEHPTDPMAALTMYDTSLAAVKATVEDPYLAAYVSLRHQVATAARMATSAHVNERSITFMIDDGELRHAFKVSVSHFQLAGSPAKADPVPVG